MKTIRVTLGVGKGTWGIVKRICSEEWDSIIIFGNQWAKDTFKSDASFKWVVLDDQEDSCQLVDAIESVFESDLGEIYINLSSGSGREHIALLSALVKNGKTFKTVCVCDDGIKMFGE